MPTTLDARIVFSLSLPFVVGCSAAARSEAEPPGPVAWRAHPTACGAIAEMPGPVRERGMQEGPTYARVAWGKDVDGSRYEIACFDLPEALDASGRAEMLAQVERWISTPPGTRIVERRRVEVSGTPAAELRLALPDAREGRYRNFIVDGQRLFEVSVVGPSGDALHAGTERFFRSFRLLTLPAEAAPSP
ncbi:hypothetical protein [Chondromyces apiculatus]|uniref:Lipoprotein n=1 Tax=Chondromyces apiculatus DSM 436 TaxID=1192034 RepID=A0A017TC87_9BACT|nr:hypothetical protein [Chondromyces apiculatus]EYF06226.1 Hypothetical protein CAP_2104 [Chondromyces apiculatus DSM 436]